MNILVIGRKNLLAVADVSEEWEIYKAMLLLGHQAYFSEYPGISTLYNLDWVFIAKTIDREEQLEHIRMHCPGAKIAYWQPDYCLIDQTEGGFQRMVDKLDLYIDRMEVEQPWFDQNHVDRKYWNFDVACYIFKPESGRDIIWQYGQSPYPLEVEIGFVGNWTHNPWRTNILRQFQYEFGDGVLHVTGSSVPEFRNRDDLRDVHEGIYGQKFNYLIEITKVNLSMESAGNKQFWGPRTARIMAAGGFALVYYVPGMEQVFGEDGVNCVYFEDTEEAISLARYYLEHELERKEIAERGQLFAEQNLRPINRVKELFDEGILM